MLDPWAIGVLALTAMVAFTIAGVAGFGGGVILMPVLVWLIGPKDAVPIVSVVAFLAALSRLGLNWRAVRWPVVGWLCLGAVPMNALASYLFVIAPPSILTRLLGLLILLFVGYRHTPWGQRQTISARGFFWVGAGSSVIDGFLGVPGPLRAPFFLAHGLTGPAYVGTTAITVIITQIPKMIVFRSNNLLEWQSLLIAGLLGLIGFLASYLGNWVARRASPRLFRVLVELVLVASGSLLLIRG